MRKLNNLNVYNYFGLKYLSGVTSDENIDQFRMFYRCHIVEDYLMVHNLPNEVKSMVGACSGVRESLGVISKFYNNRKFIIPSDVYPVYRDILEKSNVSSIQEYETLNDQKIYEFLKDSTGDTLLICFPLKPLGHNAVEQLQHISDWLDENPDRLLIVDGVYETSLGLDKDYFVKLLMSGKKVIYLNSLSKSWCLPNTFGVAIISESIEEKNSLINEFRLIEKDFEKLKKAYIALNLQRDIPTKIRNNIVDMINIVNFEYGFNLPVNSKNPSYLFKINKSYDDLLSMGIEAIKPSLYGSKNDRISIISVLI